MTRLRLRTRRLLSTLAVIGVAASTAAVAAPASAARAPFGPDVSRWQHPNGTPIDWAKVKAGGSSFAIIKATEGSGYTNPYFASDTTGARRSGLIVGAYHYARPTLPISSAASQARRFADVLGDVRTPGTMPPILDLETSGGLLPRQLVTWTQLFTETLRARTGRTPVVYTYTSFWSSQMGGTRALTRHPLWLAAYRSTPPAPVGGWPSYALWQYTASATVPGIRGKVDLSRHIGTGGQLAAFADGSRLTPWPITVARPASYVAATAGVRSATVRWMPADDGGSLPTSWTVTASPGGVRRTVVGTSTITSFDHLREGTRYSFTVRATNLAGTSASSAPSARVLARGDAPSTPTDLSSGAGKGRVALVWRRGRVAASSYTLLRCSPAPCYASRAIAHPGGAATSYVDTAVRGGVTYDYRLRAVNRWGASAAARVRATPLPTVDVLAAPTGVRVTASLRRLALTWAPVPNAARYQVLRCLGTCTPSGTPVATLDYRVRHLTQYVTAGRRYSYAVRAVAGPVRSSLSARVTGTALIAQTLRLSAPAVVAKGKAATVSVWLTRADNGRPLALRALRLTFAPVRGAAPAPVVVRTDADGVARVVIRPAVTTVLTARSTGRDLVTARTSRTLRVR